MAPKHKNGATLDRLITPVLIRGLTLSQGVPPLPPQGGRGGLCSHGGHIPPSRKKYFSIFSQYMIRYGILSVPNDFLDRFQTREVVRNDLGHDSDDITREKIVGLGGGVDT